MPKITKCVRCMQHCTSYSICIDHGLIIFSIINYYSRVSRTEYIPQTYVVYSIENYCCPGYSGTGRNCQRKHECIII